VLSQSVCKIVLSKNWYLLAKKAKQQTRQENIEIMTAFLELYIGFHQLTTQEYFVRSVLSVSIVV
jgi:hypothetical protein